MIANLALLFASSAVLALGQGGQYDAIRPFGSFKKLNKAPGCHDFSTGDHESVFMIPDAGVYQFEFGKTGTFAHQSFITDLPFVSYLELWDCFCSGDAFVVYVDGRKAFETRGQEDDECQFWSSDPTYCLVNARSDNGPNYGYTWLLPGAHNITIGVRRSPYGEGSAYINLSSVCQFGQEIGQCCWNTDIFPWDGCQGVGWCNYRTVQNACGNGCRDHYYDHRRDCGGCHRHHHHHKGIEANAENKNNNSNNNNNNKEQ